MQNKDSGGCGMSNGHPVSTNHNGVKRQGCGVIIIIFVDSRATVRTLRCS